MIKNKLKNIQIILFTIGITLLLISFYIGEITLKNAYKSHDNLRNLTNSPEYLEKLAGSNLSNQIFDLHKENMQNINEIQQLKSTLFFIAILSSFICSIIEIKNNKN